MQRGVGKRGNFRGRGRGRGGFRGRRGGNRGGGFRRDRGNFRGRGRGRRDDYHNPPYPMFNQRGRGRGRGYGHGPPMGRQQASSYMTSNTRQNSGGRMKLSNFPITGKVMSFNPEKGFGWIRPTQPVGSLPGAHLNGGRVFVHVRDLVGVESLEQDQDVRFVLYSDDKGLGAMNCTSNEAPEGMEGMMNDFGGNSQSFQTDIPQGFTDEPRTVISIYVENMYIGGIIGKKGATIKKLSEDSGAKIDITQEEKEEGEDGEKRRDPQRSRLVNLTGTSEQLKKIVKAIAKTLSGISQSLYSKITFLIHQTQAGRLIGKKGANIKKIRGDKRTVNLNISKDPVEINGQPLVTVSVFGPCNDAEDSIDEMVNQLSEIYQSMLTKYKEEQEQKLMEEQGGYGGYGGAPGGYDDFGNQGGPGGYGPPRGHDQGFYGNPFY